MKVTPSCSIGFLSLKIVTGVSRLSVDNACLNLDLLSLFEGVKVCCTTASFYLVVITYQFLFALKI